MPAEPFVVDIARASAAELHSWEPPPGRRVARWCEVAVPALVLGSAQPSTCVDEHACAAHGIEVVRRRSGGGAVLMIPGEIDWLDVVVPVGDPLWHDDVGQAMWWLGHLWAQALGACGLVPVEVHRGPLVRTRWSSVVCFDGLGSGEVVVAGHKAVGISQRRTREWLRLQSAIHRRWRPELHAELLVMDDACELSVQPPLCLDDERADLVRRTLERLLAER